MNAKVSPKVAPPCRRRTARSNSAPAPSSSCPRSPLVFAGERRKIRWRPISGLGPSTNSSWLRFKTSAWQATRLALLNCHQRQEALGVLGFPQFFKSLELHLPNPLTSQSENAGDLRQSMLAITTDSETHPDHFLFAGRKGL